MKAVDLSTLLLIISSSIKWLLVGIFQFDLVAALYGGQGAALAGIVYALVWLSAPYQLVPFFRAMSSYAVLAQRY